MCGIAGMFKGKSNYSAQQMTELVQAMCGSLVHRGPDDAGVWVSEDEQCVLGHRRLSIIDLSKHSHQPIQGQFSALTFNGEIYNYVELAQKMKCQGIDCREGSDTHTLLCGLEKSAEIFLSELDGMFAFAHYNQALGELMLVRDPFGEKPLYYTEINGAIAFASEINAFNKIPDFVGEVTADHLSLYLYFQYPPAPYTVFSNVFKLSPGSYKRFSANVSYVETAYFRPEFGGGINRDNDQSLVTQLDDVLSESLQRRLRSDVSLGAFLSGGIDSSTVVSLIAQKFDRKIDTYSVGFEDCDKSEHELAHRISKQLGTNHHTLMFDSANYADYIDVMANHCEPNADTSCIPTYLVSQITSQDHKVGLTGDGGDELFGGYSRYYSAIAAAQGKEQLMQQRKWHLGNEYINALNITPHREIRNLFGDFPSLLNDVLLQSRRQIDLSSKDYLSRFRQIDLSLYLPTVLAKVDRMSMAHSLETRTPFLSTDVFSFAAQLDTNVLFDGITSKNILRKVLGQYLPKQLIQKQKIGFSFIGDNVANAKALQVLQSRLRDEIELPNSFLVNMFGAVKLQFAVEELSLCNQTKQLQVTWALLLLNSFMKNCRYKIIA